MPTPFWTNLRSAIQSLSLEAEAKRLNAARLLRRREEQGVEALLPAAAAAHAQRMECGLAALHRAIARAAEQSGRSPTGWFRVTIHALRREWRVSHDTAARALRDLAESGLIQIRRDVRGAAAEYRIVASTVRDLAISQGLQLELFCEEAAAAECGQPGATPGRPGTTGAESLAAGGTGQPRATRGRAGSERGRRGGVSGGADPPPHGADPPPHGADPPPHGADPPPHGAEGGAPRFPLDGFKLNTPSSSSQEGGCGGEEEEEEEEVWKLIRARLRRVGVRDALGACEGASALGWTPADVLGLLAAIEARAIDGVPPWQPGAIYWHLRRSDPGTLIALPESEEWLRAKAAREQRTRLTAATVQGLPTGPTLDDRLGPRLDSLTTAEVHELAAEIPPPVGPVIRRRLADWSTGTALPPSTRVPLLQVLQRRQEAAHE